MTPAARQAMIRGMVDGLAARLEASPRDADGWLQLIRSRRILGEMDAARDALTKATAAFSDSPAEQARLTAAAIELGVTR
jgi:cytochrome c-type biogenesis protein CcmH